MQKTQIHPTILQPFFESASNAADKGQAQWFTPPEWGRTLSRALNRYRPVIVDLTCGNGQLLESARSHSRLFGCDIQADSALRTPHSAFVQADLTVFYGLLAAVNWEADCFVLNPPWDLHWYRERLAPLATSTCLAVREAFAEHDGRLSRATIDSTAATLMIALDRMSHYGDGFLIANEATLQRLILGQDAPHGALARHVWAHLVVAGNLCMESKSKGKPASPDDFQTGILWFSRGHEAGLIATRGAEGCASHLKDAERFVERLREQRPRYRKGMETSDYHRTHDTESLWSAAAEEWARLSGVRSAECGVRSYHLWLEAGCIRTNLSLFDTASGRVSKDAAATLYELTDKQPMQLVIDRASRHALQTAAGPDSPWRVHPELTAAVAEALRQFEGERTPLAALPAIQRLGFLDEHDFITCRRDLAEFRAGGRYPLRSTTVLVKRQTEKRNLWGVLEEIELDGQELAFFITDANGKEQVFMEARLREPGVTVHVIKPGVRELARKIADADLTPCPIDYTVPELVNHFIIPDVPHAAVVFRQQYDANLQTLVEIENLVNA